MRKIALSFAALMILLTVAAWTQTEHKAERITNGPLVKELQPPQPRLLGLLMLQAAAS
jgi:hypothetical protein